MKQAPHKFTYAFAENAKTEVYLNVDLQGFIASLEPGRSFAVVTDRHVFELYESELTPYHVIVLPAGEDTKSFLFLQKLLDQMFQLELDRSSILIGLGGGVITDVCGFAASVFMRGISCAYVPTTLLGQVDAALGGKTAINTPQGKNLVGRIQQPESVLIHPRYLETLPPDELKNGLAEIIKYGVIAEPNILDILLDNPDPIPVLGPLISECIHIKMQIVNTDPKEQSGVRSFLNFGHTLGHAIEWIEKIPHGQAVAIGMVLEAAMCASEKPELKPLAEKIAEVVKIQGLPGKYTGDAKALIDRIRFDKKKGSSGVKMPWLEGPGSCSNRLVTFEELEQMVSPLLQ